MTRLASLADDASLRQALAALRTLDPGAIGIMIDRIGQPALRRREPGLAGLAAIIVAQKISTASAAAILGRLSVAVVLAEPESMLAASDETLRGCGLSAGKIRTLRAAAAAVQDGTLRLQHLGALPAEEARGALLAVPGVGPWTADVFLLFCLGHSDAWPAGDLALQEAVRLVLGLERRPDAASMVAIAQRWHPYRGAAATLLWAYYRACKGRASFSRHPSRCSLDRREARSRTTRETEG